MMSGKTFGLLIVGFGICIVIAIVIYIYFKKKSNKDSSSPFITINPPTASSSPEPPPDPQPIDQPDLDLCIGKMGQGILEKSMIDVYNAYGACGFNGFTYQDRFKAYSKPNPNVSPWCVGYTTFPADQGLYYKMLPQADCGGTTSDGIQWTHQNTFYLPNTDKENNLDRLSICLLDPYSPYLLPLYPIIMGKSLIYKFAKNTLCPDKLNNIATANIYKI